MGCSKMAQISCNLFLAIYFSVSAEKKTEDSRSLNNNATCKSNAN